LVGELREANRRPANQSGYNAVYSNQPIGHAFLSRHNEVILTESSPKPKQPRDMASRSDRWL